MSEPSSDTRNSRNGAVLEKSEEETSRQDDSGERNSDKDSRRYHRSRSRSRSRLIARDCSSSSSRSSRDENGRRRKERKRSNRRHRSKQRKKHRRRSRSSSSDTDNDSESPSSSSSSSDNNRNHRRHTSRKKRRHRKKKTKERSKSKLKRSKRRRERSIDRSTRKESQSTIPANEGSLPEKNEDPTVIEAPATQGVDKSNDSMVGGKREHPSSSLRESESGDRRKRMMIPMTKEEWEKKQSQVTEVYDPQSGRYRLVRGNGEIVERIVSREMHQSINQQATRGDGVSFSSSIYNARHR